MPEVEQQQEEVKKATFRNNSDGPVKLKIGPGIEDINVPPGGSITGPAHVLWRFIGVLDPVEEAVSQQDPRPVPEPDLPEIEQEGPETDEISSESDEEEGAVSETEQELIDMDVWHPNIGFMDYEEINYQKATNEQFHFILEHAGIAYEEDEQKSDLWKKIKSLMS